MNRVFPKKILVFLTAVGVFSLGLVGALAVVPHVHGHDLDHSSHSTCPVHQVASVSVFAAVFAAVLVTFARTVSFRKERKLSFVFFSPAFFLRLRAPPAS